MKHWDYYCALHFAAYKISFYTSFYLFVPLEHTASFAAVTSAVLSIRVFWEVTVHH
jgi:hypothetical protein